MTKIGYSILVLSELTTAEELCTLYTGSHLEAAMKYIGLLVLTALVGCASSPTTEELEVDAAKTGDWSAVEDRERMNEKMRVVPELKCPEHLMLICIKDGEHEECFCQPPH